MRLLIAAIILAASTTATRAETWFCAPDDSAGFNWNLDREKWEAWRPSVETDYTITRDGESWSYSGGPFAKVDSCTVGPSPGWVTCETFINEFRFNPNNGRFFYAYFGGVLSTGHPELNTAVVDVGTCRPE